MTNLTSAEIRAPTFVAGQRFCLMCPILSFIDLLAYVGHIGNDLMLDWGARHWKWRPLSPGPSMVAICKQRLQCIFVRGG
jgi:hypothetical protein